MTQTRSHSDSRPLIPTAAPRPLKALLLLLIGCPTLASAQPTEVEMVGVMEQHYQAAIAAHDALIRDDIGELRHQLAKIGTQPLPDNAPPNWWPYDSDLREAARDADNATDRESAGAAMGSVAEACGACHAALGVEKIYFWPAQPEGEASIGDTMQTHQWATERLWEGVTGPWDNAWERGSAALAVSEVFRPGVGVVATDNLRAREAELQELGQQARQEFGQHERATLYGRLLTTCAGCHEEAGVIIELAPPPPWQK